MAIIHECAKSITSAAPKDTTTTPDEFGRVPFSNPLLDSLDNLTSEQPKNIVSVENLERVALEVGLLKALRWKPRFVCFPPPAFHSLGSSLDVVNQAIA